MFMQIIIVPKFLHFHNNNKKKKKKIVLVRPISSQVNSYLKYKMLNDIYITVVTLFHTVHKFSHFHNNTTSFKSVIIKVSSNSFTQQDCESLTDPDI